MLKIRFSTVKEKLYGLFTRILGGICILSVFLVALLSMAWLRITQKC